MLGQGSRLALSTLALCLAHDGVCADGSPEPTTGDPSSPQTRMEASVRPLPWLGETCSTTSLPRLSGGWIFGCSSDGRPDRALQVANGEQHRFAYPEGDWGISNGVVLDLQRKTAFEPGRDGARLTPISSPLHAPLVSDGQTVVFSGERGIETMLLGGNTRTRLSDSKPAPWYPPAINDHGLFWVELHDGQEEIHWRPHNTESQERFAAGPMPLRHVVGEGDHVAWMSDSAVFLKNLSTAEFQEFPAVVHSNDSLTLSDGLVCFEALDEHDLDIFCSNGFHLKRPGDQRRPSIWRDWLVFHEGRQTLLYGPIK